MQTKKAFSFVEIIITISIIALLVVIWISSKSNYDNNMNNTKVISDVETINNAIISYSQETKTLPMPGGNTNFFWADTGYMHSYEDVDTFWVYGSLTEDTIAKKYLDVLPLDPRTNSYYAYGKTKASNKFEIASIQVINDVPTAKVSWNYENENWPLNLIRQYNGSNFVYDGSTNALPYNPEELVLIVTTADWTIYREWEEINVNAWENLEIFFSDWSVSIIEGWASWAKITLNELNFKWKDNLNTIVKLWLEAGKIWTRATHLNDDSEFEVYTQDSAAAVRWTIFSVSHTNNEVEIIEWTVEVYKTDYPQSLEVTVNKWETPKKINLLTSPNTTEDSTITSPEFSDNWKSTDLDDTITWWRVTCTKFEWDLNECVEHDQELFDDGYKLIAYAPYNEAWDLNMYTRTGTVDLDTENIIFDCSNWTWPQCTSTWWTFWAIEYDNDNSFVTYKDWTRWIYIDNIHDTNSGNDKLMYSDIGWLSGDYAIEMSVSRDALEQDWGRYIFDTQLNYLWLMINKLNTGDFIVMYKWDYICSDYDNIHAPKICKLNFKDNFEKIIVENWNKITIWWETFPMSHNINITDLFIWSKKDSTWQINWIVDYVKIYSKD